MRMRRIIFIMPLFSVSIMCTFESGIILYFLISSMLHFSINYWLLTEKMRKRLGVNNFLPGTKLEKYNHFRIVNNKVKEGVILNVPLPEPAKVENIEVEKLKEVKPKQQVQQGKKFEQKKKTKSR
jgi:hypothetical protein